MTYVGTPLGVASSTTGVFSRPRSRVLATALLATPSQLYVGSEPGRDSIPLEDVVPILALTLVRSCLKSINSFCRATQCSRGRNGLYRMNRHGLGWQQFSSRCSRAQRPKYFALAADTNGRLWSATSTVALTFLRQTTPTRPIWKTNMFCINRILLDGKTNMIDVATANGLVRFDKLWRRATGADSRDDLSPTTSRMWSRTETAWLSQSRRLDFPRCHRRAQHVRLPRLGEQHVYALGVSGTNSSRHAWRYLGVGTGRRGGNYTTTTSNLTHNWITAVVRVGRNGWSAPMAQAFSVLTTPTLSFFRERFRQFEINPNAMLVTPDISAGTLGKGLYSTTAIPGAGR